MPLWFVMATLAVVVLSSIATRSLYRRSEAHQVGLIADEQFASLRRLAWRSVNALVVVFWYVGGSVFLISAAADDAETAAAGIRAEVVAACDDSREFRARLGIIAQENIDNLVQERDDLADSILETPINIQAIPAFSALPESVRLFLEALLESQIAQARTELDSMNDEIVRLMAQRDEIVASSREDCPS